MLYRLEEHLPVAAEEVVADFVPPADREAPSQLGVAIERRLLDPIVAAVEAAGLRVGAICPAALLVLQAGILGIPDVPGCRQRLAGRVRDLRRRRAGLRRAVRPRRRAAGRLVRRAGGARRRRAPRPHGTAAEPRAGLGVGVGRRAGGGAARHRTRTDRPVAGEAAGISRGWQRRRPLHRRRSRTSVGRPGRRRRRQRPRLARGPRGEGVGGRRRVRVAGGPSRRATLWRAARYERLAARYEAEQQDVFRRALPGQPVPADVRSRLASEARQAGRGGAGGDRRGRRRRAVDAARPDDVPADGRALPRPRSAARRRRVHARGRGELARRRRGGRRGVAAAGGVRGRAAADRAAARARASGSRSTAASRVAARRGRARQPSERRASR